MFFTTQSLCCFGFKSSLDLNAARDDLGFLEDGSGISICKQSAARSRLVTTPTPHHSVFTGRMLFLTRNQQCQSTEGKLLCQYGMMYASVICQDLFRNLDQDQ